MKTLVSEIFKYSDSINNNRNSFYVLAKCIEELGELSVELQIAEGVKNKQSTKNAVVVEAIDVITCAVDIIRLTNPDLTEDDIVTIATAKLEKWKSKATIDIKEQMFSKHL